MAARHALLLISLIFSACASAPRAEESDQFIRVENPNQFNIRAYVAFETSPTARVLLGTLEPYQSEIFPLPVALSGHRRLIVHCEKGPAGRFFRASEYFETSFVMMPQYSMLVVRIRDPLRYSDFTLSSAE